MGTLGELISKSLKNASIPSTKLLHKIVFGNDGDRFRRAKLKSFSGFGFAEQSQEFKNKIKFVTENFELGNLIIVCSVLNINYDGSADEVIKRIVSSLSDLKVLEGYLLKDAETEDEDISNEISGEIKSESKSSDSTKLTMGFNEMSSIIKPFDGSEYNSVDKWLKEFEDLSIVMQWSATHKFVFAKRSLTGIAKLFIQSQSNVTSWDRIKFLLKKEFGDGYNSAKLHRMLAKRQMQNSETVHEYFFRMSELASQGKIEDEALIEYVIAGINDFASNKTILYGADDLEEFREKLKVYEKIRLDSKKPKLKPDVGYHNKQKADVGFSSKQTYLPEKKKGYKERCFSCGALGHKSNFCPDKNKGVKCFSCNSYGHLSNRCKNDKNEREKQKNETLSVIEMKPANKLCKLLTIDNFQFQFLADTGSDVNVLREDVYNKLGKPQLVNNILSLAGIGSNQVQTKGSLIQKVNIDGECFDLLFHVVGQNDLKFEIIIGTEILKYAAMHVDKQGVTFTKSADGFNLLHIGDFTNEINREMDLHHIRDKENREIIASLIADYKPNKTEETDIKMKIILTDNFPVYQKPRRLAVSEKQEVEAHLNEWLKNGIIRPSSSDYASAVVLVRKRDGNTRLCVDYRNLNKKIVRDRFPLPVIDDVLDKLQNAQVFTTLGLKNGFFHVDVHEDSRKYTVH